MTSDKSPATDQLRRRAEATREELGRTVAALTARNDVQGTLMHRAGRAGAKAHEAASRIGDLVRTKTPEPVRGRAVRAALRTRRQAAHAGRLARAKAPAALRAGVGRTARTARAHRAPLLGAGAALGVFLFVRRATKRG
ncbi:DUF3618 domain-containing protein [Streptomyces sp. NPDC026673]|uniref:DUF3618 domain-containing protein n=1 Tax=Streptomyces sp. NPDC026673 TaxID=3155724 RepID=UPI0033EA5378